MCPLLQLILTIVTPLHPLPRRSLPLSGAGANARSGTEPESGAASQRAPSPRGVKSGVVKKPVPEKKRSLKRL